MVGNKVDGRDILSALVSKQNERICCLSTYNIIFNIQYPINWTYIERINFVLYKYCLY